MSRKRIEAVLKERTPALMSLAGVVGTGQGMRGGAPCIRVFVVKRTPDLERSIGTTIEGYPVVIVETGALRALDPE